MALFRLMVLGWRASCADAVIGKTTGSVAAATVDAVVIAIERNSRREILGSKDAVLCVVFMESTFQKGRIKTDMSRTAVRNADNFLVSDRLELI